MTEPVQKHLRARSGDVAPYVLIPGDPARAERIAESFAEARLVSRHREYTLFTGSTEQGTPISVCSTGIGGPSTAVGMEELKRIGATHFIRVGSAGGRQPDIPIGSTVVATAAYRGDGTAQEYAPLAFPAVADLGVTNALVNAAAGLGRVCWSGVAYTRDAFYRRDAALAEMLTEAGVVAAEMECSTVFVVASVLGVKAGAVLGTDSNIWLDEQPSQEEKERLYMEGERSSIAVALAAVDALHAASWES